jgi:hypothetical protein
MRIIPVALRIGIHNHYRHRCVTPAIEGFRMAGVAL